MPTIDDDTRDLYNYDSSNNSIEDNLPKRIIEFMDRRQVSESPDIFYQNDSYVWRKVIFDNSLEKKFQEPSPDEMKLNSNFICPILYRPMYDAVSLQTKGSFHLQTISEEAAIDWFIKKGKTSCPLTRQEVVAILINSTVRNVVTSILKPGCSSMFKTIGNLAQYTDIVSSSDVSDKLPEIKISEPETPVQVLPHILEESYEEFWQNNNYKWSKIIFDKNLKERIRELNVQEKEFNSNLICPILYRPMYDAVSLKIEGLSDLQTISEEAAIEWFINRGQTSCPITKGRVTDIFINPLVRNIVADELAKIKIPEPGAHNQVLLHV